MDSTIQTDFNNLESQVKNVQYEAFQRILAATEEEVDWAYEVWDTLVAGLTDSNNHTRSRYAQFLAGLAKSDPEKRILTDFPALWEVTKDEKFVTARHSLQAIWRVGLAGHEQKQLVINHLVNRFETCMNEKNYTLIRFDIIQGMRNLYDEIHDEKIKVKALELIEKEKDPKYQKKYAKVWKNV
ncbi:hypothetical protein CIL03_17100 [Virgibacillus indicus]|uniref:HEAT repeat domain-containing protein n=1 Tax=Virgibacillus indicus TaxID=2024554 RepID=A0A265N759_9BACI|nr:hypothetical protein [Virgibacillus indicus]OZU87314.1 hypothetical protein CIL03_17100 [Virgibacillus indicus]